MALPGTSITTADGSVAAAQLVSGKEYPVGMVADPSGHILGSLPAWGLFIGPSAVGAGKQWFDLFNAQASTVLRLKKLFAVVSTDVGVTGTLGVRLDTFRTSAVGTGGTAATVNSTSTTAPSFAAFNPADTLPSGVTARAIPTGGGTLQAMLFHNMIFTEETNVSTQVSQFFNLLPELNTQQCIDLPTGFGLKVVQGSVASVGSIGFYAVFTVE